MPRSVFVVFFVVLAVAGKPLVALSARAVPNSAHHYSFSVPDVWTEWENSPIAAADPKKITEHVFRANGTVSPTPVVTVTYDEDAHIIADPVGFAWGIKAGVASGKLPAGIAITRNDAVYDPLTHRITTDLEIERGGVPLTHTRSIYTFGGRCVVGVTMIDRATDFVSNQTLQQETVDSIRFDPGYEYVSAKSSALATTPSLNVGSLAVMLVLFCAFLGITLLVVVAVILIVRKARKPATTPPGPTPPH